MLLFSLCQDLRRSNDGSMPYCVDCGLILELARLYFCYVLLTVGVRLVDDFKQCCSMAANNMAVLAIWLADCLCECGLNMLLWRVRFFFFFFY